MNGWALIGGLLALLVLLLAWSLMRIAAWADRADETTPEDHHP